jgi:hypothetical protein
VRSVEVEQVRAVGGQWRVLINIPGRGSTEITAVRGVPVKVGSLITTDPFGPATAELMFPQITMLDELGSGELWWAVPDANVDIVWDDEDPSIENYTWQGFTASFDWNHAENEGSLTIGCSGAMRQLDNYLAKPEYLARPITFEHAIARQFRSANKPGLRLSGCSIQFPSWWEKRYARRENQQWYMRPQGVKDGALWTGLLTRDTGSWTPALTGYIQALLSSMWTEVGQWTLSLQSSRTPLLHHRTLMHVDDEDTWQVSLLWPGVTASLSADYSQRLNVAYGVGRSLAGLTFSGMNISVDGRQTSYSPFAASPAVEPESTSNPRRDLAVMRREAKIDFFEGLTPESATDTARSQLHKFSDPGVVGTLTLRNVDPVRNGRLLPRQLIRAGANVRVDGLFGRFPGPVMHVTQAAVDADTESIVLTVDSRFRDRLTVEEVRKRGRDSLQVARQLVTGRYQPNIPDQLLPWNYNKGSGFAPLKAKDLFEGAPAGLTFPWEEWTTTRPPKNAAWRSCYIKIPKANHRDANDNWNRPPRAGVPAAKLRLSQAGSIRMLQFAAFDRNGNIKKVPFHVSIWALPDAKASEAPRIPKNYTVEGRLYKEPQYYPFVRNGWEDYKVDGTRIDGRGSDSGLIAGSTLLVAYGNYWEQAGYWPNSSREPGAEPTGLLVDETPLSYDGTITTADFDPVRDDNTFAKSATFTVLIFCDADTTGPTFFLGRLFRSEYGTS